MKNSLLIFLFLVTAIRGYSQCTLSVSVSSSGPAVCSGSNVVLTATATGGTGPYSYAWSNGDVTSTTPVNKAGTYTVTVSDKTPGCQPVKQSITITSAAVPTAPTAANVVVCVNTPATLTATAPGGNYQWYDAATGGNFLGSGATYVTPPIAANTVFYVQTTLNGCTSSRSAVTVSIPSVPPTANATICAGTTASLQAANGINYAWYASAGGGTVLSTNAIFVTPILFTTTTYYVVVTNSNGCVSAPIPVTANVTPQPVAPTVPPVTICASNVASLHATAPAGIIDWFTVPVGGTSLISSPDFTTPPLAATTTYYVQTTLNTCESTRTPVTVTVNPIPSAPVVPPAATCAGSSATLTPTGPGGTYSWFNVPTGGVLLATGPSFTTPALASSTTYYVEVTNGGCSSVRTAVPVTVTALPSSPSASGAAICSGTTATLTATSPGGVYQWYDAAVGGTLLATNPSYTTPPLIANTTYYVQTTVAGCTSPRTPVTVTIIPLPAPPVAPGVTICSGNSATLTITAPAGTYAWYDAAVGGNLLINGGVYVTPALVANTTYYVQFISSSGCASTRTPVTVTVTPPPGPPVISGTSVCPGSAATLTAVAAGTVSWYDAAIGGNLLVTGNSFTTPALNATTTYYADQTTGTCLSSRVAVTVSVISGPSPQFQYPTGTFCKTAANPTPVINNPAGGTFSAAPAGLVFVSTTTGQINLVASLPGQYVISFAGNGVCPATTNAVVTISLAPSAQFSYAGPYCQDAAIGAPTFPAGSSAGVFSATPAGLVFINTSTGDIDLVRSTAGVTYTVTNTIAASGTCAANSFSNTVFINPSVLVSAGPNQVLPIGTPVTMAGSVTRGAATGTWSGGTGSFSNPTALNAIYTPGPGETSATLTLTSADPPGPCGAKTSSLLVTFTPGPAAPTVAPALICSGSSGILSPTAPGGVYSWYDAPVGGNLLATGSSFVTPSLVANTTYYVQTTLNGATSPRAAVTVSISALPALPVVSGATTICAGNTTTLTASGSAGVYQWYDAPVGGNLLATGPTYTTTFLNANTSYYVDALVTYCTSARTRVDVTVHSVPDVTSSSTANVCSGVALNYTITSSVAGATFTWSRAAVAGISNPAVSNQPTSTITETLTNTTAAPINVTYVITPLANGCSGVPFNYVVTVNPAPVVTSAPAVTACDQTPINYNITFNTPGTTFTWSRAAVAGITNAPIAGQGASTIRESLFNTTNAPIDVTYVINYQTASCSGLVFNLTVTADPPVMVTSAPAGTACSGVPQGYAITSNVAGATYSWSRAAVAGISNPAVLNQPQSTISESLINTTASKLVVVYMITPTGNGCSGTPFKYSVTVYPSVPTPVANANSPICSGADIDLQSPIIPNATYNWSGPNGFTSAQQNPTITNAGVINSGTYNLFITINGCASATASVTVMVDPPPLADAGPPQQVCTNVASVQLAGSVTGGTTTGLWTTTGSGTFSPAPSALNALYLPSAADIAAGSVVLTLASTSKDNCSFSSSNVTITFKAPSVTSAPSGSICNAVAQNYVITSDVPTATFTWSRAAVAGITNPAVAGQTSGTITEILNNPGNTAIDVIYIITPNNAGCPGKPFTLTVTVNPTPVAPIITVNSPVCVNSTIQLNTPALAGATYSWTGPNGFSSASQNPTVPNVTAAAAGTYMLTVSANGCTGPSSSATVVVDALPISNAGPTQTVCPVTPSVQLAGTETGGTPTGTWSTSGTGTFSSPTALNALYFPSAADAAAGSVTLTLASTSADDCAISTSTVVIKFQLLPALTAGPDQSICSQSAASLAGQITIPGGAVWSTSGSGTFAPSAAQLNATYLPSAADVKNGFVVLTLTANNPGQCYIPTDVLTLKLIPPPTVSAGKPILILKGHTATLSPTVSDPNVTYLWSPNIDISNPNIENPVITGTVDRTYTLTVTDIRGCQSSASVDVTVSPEIIIPNTFTPNGDGINDQWNIQGIIAYQQATVDVFDRNGQKIFHSVGYGTPWDGTFKGQQVPYGVYYYIIDPKTLGLKVLSGSITVIR